MIMTTPMAMLMIWQGDKNSNQFSSLEKNVVERGDNGGDMGDIGDDLKKNAALVFLLSFLLVFLIMFSVFITIIRMIQHIRKLKKMKKTEINMTVENRDMEWCPESNRRDLV